MKKKQAESDYLPIPESIMMKNLGFDTLFRICEHCNKEYEPTLHPSDDGKMLISNIQNCPLCGKRDDVWVKVFLKWPSRGESGTETK